MDPFTLFEPEFARRALAATVLVALAGGLLGSTVVLRDLPFFAHAVGAGAYPALVLGAVWGASVFVMGLAGALLFAGLLWLISMGRGADPRVRDTRTGLLVAASLAIGAVLASAYGGDVAVVLSPEAMLFGSVLTVDSVSVYFAGLVAALVALSVFMRGDRWLAAGFDRGAARNLGVAGDDWVMLQMVAIAVAAALPLTGALMAGALLVIPAATARLIVKRAAAMTIVAPLIAVCAGVLGLYLSLALDLPAGASIAAVAGGVFVVAAIGVSVAPVFSRAGRTAVPAAALLAVVVVASGCGSNPTTGSAGDQGDGVAIVATTTQTADLVRQLGGEHVRVTTLLKAGADPHGFEPTPSDVAALEDARLVFRNGGELDSWLLPAVKAAGGKQNPVDLSNGAVLLERGLPDAGGASRASGDFGGSDETFNAHWSLDPDNLRSVALLVRDELIKADPARRETYRARTAGYRDRVASADDKLRACVKTVPEADRAVAAGHDDFVYLTERFGIETAAMLHASGGEDPSASDVERATKDARSGGARAMLVSKGEAGRLERAVADELNVPLLELYGDSLAASGAAATALGAIGYNTGRIVDAAGGDAAGCSAAG